MSEKQFLVSVADAYLYDDVTDTLVLKAKALLNSSIQQAIQSQSIKAGKGAQLVFEYSYGKEITFNIEDAEFNEAYICLQNNTAISNELSDFQMDEVVLFNASGVATLTETPLKTVYIENENGTHTSVLASGKTVTSLVHANKEISVVYMHKAQTDNIVISASSFPRAYRLVLNADIFTNAGKKSELQIVAPQFKPDGAMDLSLSSEGVSSSKMNGKTLSDAKGNYAYFNFKNVASSEVQVSELATSPSEVQLEASVVGDNEQLTVIGIRGGVYANVMMDNSKLTFTSDDLTVAKVSATGLIEKGTSATVGKSTLIRITDGTYTDIVEVEII
ncbi:hypothetical protein [Psychrobacillus phage Perkons]|nr:hypothetical protein [Psychrobacillus phage Perkons]